MLHIGHHTPLKLLKTPLSGHFFQAGAPLKLSAALCRPAQRIKDGHKHYSATDLRRGALKGCGCPAPGLPGLEHPQGGWAPWDGHPTACAGLQLPRSLPLLRRFPKSGSHRLNTCQILALRTPRKAALWRQWAARGWLQPLRTSPWYGRSARRGAALPQPHLSIAGGQAQIFSLFLVLQTGGWANSPFNPPEQPFSHMTNSSARVTSAFSRTKALLPVLGAGRWLPSSPAALSPRDGAGSPPARGGFHGILVSALPARSRVVRRWGGRTSLLLCRQAQPVLLDLWAARDQLPCKRHVPAASLGSDISGLGLAGSSSAGARQGRSAAGRINSPSPSGNGGQGGECRAERPPIPCPTLGTTVSEGKKWGEPLPGLHPPPAAGSIVQPYPGDVPEQGAVCTPLAQGWGQCLGWLIRIPWKPSVPRPAASPPGFQT